MANYITRLLNVVFAGLLAGALLVILMGYDPAHFTFETYRQVQQGAINSLNTLMPVIGMICILLTIANAGLHRKQKGRLAILIIASIFLIGSGLITRFGNQVINTQVMTWQENRVVSEWDNLRTKWVAFHRYRTVLTVLAFFLIAAVSIRSDELRLK